MLASCSDSNGWDASSYANGDAGHVSYPLGHLVALTLILMTRDARSVNGPLKISARNKSRARAEIFRETPVRPVLHDS